MLSPPRQPPPTWKRYAVAVTAWGVAAGITVAFLLTRNGATHAIGAYMLALLIAGCYGGTGPALVALALTFLADQLQPVLLRHLEPFTFNLRDVWFGAATIAAAYFGVHRRHLIEDLTNSRDRLEELVAERTAELRRKEFYLEQAQRLGHAGLWAVQNESAGYSYVSDEVYLILGLDPATATMPPAIYAAVHPDDRLDVERQARRALAEGKPLDLEARIIRPDGEVRHVRVVGELVPQGSAGAGEYAGVFMDVTERRRAEESLRRAREQSLLHRFEARLEERNRIARELHDTLLQGFTGVALQLLAVVERVRAPREDVAALRHVLELAEQTLRDARLAIWDMRAPSEGGSWPDALRAAVEEIAQSAGVALRFEVTGEAVPLSEAMESALGRIAREAVLNAVKHAQARDITVRLGYRRQFAGLVVSDDGRGFVDDPALESSGGHLGLLGMRERAARVGGRLKVRSSPGMGTTVRIVVPIANGREAARAESLVR